MAKPGVADAAIADVRRRIASAIAEQRVQRGWDQTTLARRAEISLLDLQGIEAEIEPCFLDTLTTIARAFGVSVERFLEKRDHAAH
jgi:transcriptional regulator with XRE-family HTH domain